MHRLTLLTTLTGVLLALAVFRTSALEPAAAPIATATTERRAEATPTQTAVTGTPTAPARSAPPPGPRRPTATPTLGPMLSRLGLPVTLEAQDTGLWVVATDGSWRWRAPIEPGYNPPVWSPDGSVAAVHSIDGAIYLVTPLVGVRRLADAPHQQLLWARDGSGMLLLARDYSPPTHPNRYGYRVSWLSTNGDLSELTAGRDAGGPEPTILGWLPDGRRALIRLSSGAVLEVDVEARTALPYGGLDGVSVSSLSVDGHWMALVRPGTLSPADPRWSGTCNDLTVEQQASLEVFNTVSGARWTVLRGLCNVLGTLWSPDSRKLAYSHYSHVRITGTPPIGVVDVASGTTVGMSVPNSVSCAFLDSWSPDSSRVLFRGVVCDSDAGISAYRTLDADGGLVSDHRVEGSQASGGLGAGNRWLHGHRELRVVHPDGVATVLDELDGLTAYGASVWSRRYDTVAYMRRPSAVHGWFFHVDLSGPSVQRHGVPQQGTPTCPSSRTGAHLVDGDYWDRPLRLRTPEGGSLLLADSASLVSCLWSRDGARVAFTYHVVSESGRRLTPERQAAVFDVSRRQLLPLGLLAVDGRVAAWAPDSSAVAFLSRGAVRVYRIADGEPLDNYAGTAQVNDAAAVAWSPDGLLLAVASGVRVLRFDVASSTRQSESAPAHNPILWVGWSRGDAVVAAVSDFKGSDLASRLYVISGSTLTPLADTGPFRHPAVSPDGRWVAVPGWQRLVLLATDGSGALSVVQFNETKNIEWVDWQSHAELRFYAGSCCL